MFKFFPAPPDGATIRSIKSKTADFPIFRARIVISEQRGSFFLLW